MSLTLAAQSTLLTGLALDSGLAGYAMKITIAFYSHVMSNVRNTVRSKTEPIYVYYCLLNQAYDLLLF